MKKLLSVIVNISKIQFLVLFLGYGMKLIICYLNEIDYLLLDWNEWINYSNETIFFSQLWNWMNQLVTWMKVMFIGIPKMEAIATGGLKLALFLKGVP